VKSLLYACTTAADLGHTVLDEKLPELRLYAAARDWEVAGEYTDAIPTGIGRRPGFAKLCDALRAGAGNVVIATSISDLCWDISTGLRRLHELGLGAQVSLVCLRNSFDATTPTGQLRLLDTLALIAEHRRDRARDRQRIGVLRAIAKNGGSPISGRPRSFLHLMEIRPMYERGLSQSEMLKTLRSADWEVSKSKLSAMIRTYRESGEIGPESEAARVKAIVDRGGLPCGGRQIRGRPLKTEDLIPLYERGLSQRKMLAALRTTGWTGTRQKLADTLKQFLADGDISPRSEAARADAIEERRARHARRKKAA
jgi:DNA invertase Pin-like site-specific DNA recombinase